MAKPIITLIILSLSLSFIPNALSEGHKMDASTKRMIQQECPSGWIYSGGNLYVHPIVNECYNFTGKLLHIIRKNDKITGYLYIVMSHAIFHTKSLLPYGTYVKLTNSVYTYYDFAGNHRVAPNLRKLY